MGGNQKNKNYKIKWSPEFAYAIGLIATDGSLSKDGRHIIMRSSELPQLRTFKKCLNLTNKISETKNNGYAKKPAYRVQFSNVILYKYLLSIGLMPKKTKIMASLKIPDKYFFDFLRGCIDGDGCIQKYQDTVYPNSQRIYTKLTAYSKRHLEWIQSQTKKLLNVCGYIQKRPRTHQLVFAKKDSLKLLSLLYSNPKAPCLKRKYKIIKDVI